MAQSDQLVDRRRLKQQLTFWRLLALVAVALAVVLVAGGPGARTGILPLAWTHVARLNVDGIVLEDPERDDALEAVKDDPRVKALVVRINSPGGTAAGGEALYRSLRRVAETKPVVAVMSEVAASGGYMVALGADRIFAREGTITGSIGVLWQTTNVTELLKKVGISTEAFKSGPLKAQPSPLEPLTPEVRKVTQALVEDVHRSFLAMVAERRSLPPAAVERLADGRVFTGRQALEAGLVDEIGGESEARAWLARERQVSADLPIYDLTYGSTPFWTEAVHVLFGKVLFSERLTLDGLMAVWHAQ